MKKKQLQTLGQVNAAFNKAAQELATKTGKTVCPLCGDPRCEISIAMRGEVPQRDEDSFSE